MLSCRQNGLREETTTPPRRMLDTDRSVNKPDKKTLYLRLHSYHDNDNIVEPTRGTGRPQLSTANASTSTPGTTAAIQTGRGDYALRPKLSPADHWPAVHKETPIDVLHNPKVVIDIPQIQLRGRLLALIPRQQPPHRPHWNLRINSDSSW